MSNPDKYGSRYWAITGEGDPLYLFADRLEVQPSGALVAYGGFRTLGEKAEDGEQAIYAIAAGQWHTFYAASLMNNGFVADASPD